MKITSFAVAAILLLSATFSDAQTIKSKSIYAKQKTFEIGGDFMFNSTEYFRSQTSISSVSNSSTTTNLIINGAAGIFVIDNLKLSIEPAIQLSYFEGDSWRQLKIYFSPEYYFNMKGIVYPYLGGAAGYSSESFSGSNSPSRGGFSWGLKGGIKVNAFGNALINAGVSYYRETYDYSDIYLGDVKQHYNILGFKVGISIFFR